MLMAPASFWPIYLRKNVIGEQFAKQLRKGEAPEQANMIGRHAQALIRHAHLLVDALQFSGEDESHRKGHAVFAFRAKRLRQLMPLWLNMKVWHRCRIFE